jgi:transcriptional regulator NrdR family protein
MGEIMKCPYCQSDKTKIEHTRRKSDDDPSECYTERERRCLDCSEKFSTFESYEKSDPEAFLKSRDALKCIRKAISHLEFAE